MIYNELPIPSKMRGRIGFLYKVLATLWEVSVYAEEFVRE